MLLGYHLEVDIWVFRWIEVQFCVDRVLHA